MRVRELMQKNVRTVDQEAAVNEAVVSLSDSHISALAVVDGMGRMVGVISSTDILTSEAEAQDAVEREALFEQIAGPRHNDPASTDYLAGSRGERRRVISTTDIMRAVATGRL